MEKVIEFATEKDTKEMLDIYTPYVLETPTTFEYIVPPFKEFKERITTNTKQFPWLVYRIDGIIAGYAYSSLFKTKAAFWWDTEATIYLNKEHRGKGIGKALYKTLIEILALQGYYNIYALITSSNIASIQFHEMFDFKPVGFYENTGYKQGEWHSLTILHKKLREYTMNPVEPTPYHLLPKEDLDNILKKYVSQHDSNMSYRR